MPWRPRPLAGGAALSLFAHGALIAALGWHAAAPRTPASGGSGKPVMLWLLHAQRDAAAEPAPAPPPKVTQHAPVRRRAAAVAAKAALPAPVAEAPIAAAPQAAASEPVRGIAFAAPAIDLGFGSSARGATRAGAAPSAQPVPHGPPPEVLAQAARQAGLAQLARELQQRLASLQAPLETPRGECTPVDDPASPLACDSSALQEAVRDEAPALAGLLRAYRGLDPRLSRVALSYSGEGYRLEAR